MLIYNLLRGKVRADEPGYRRDGLAAVSSRIASEETVDDLSGHPALAAFWREFLGQYPGADAEGRFLEHFQFGTSPASADELARLVVAGTKTATSSVLWQYEGTNRRVPKAGDLSIVTDGDGRPVCIIETTEVRVIPFRDVDAGFAWEYGEDERTLAWWRTVMWESYGRICASIGRQPSRAMPLVCERFRVVYAPTPA